MSRATAYPRCAPEQSAARRPPDGPTPGAPPDAAPSRGPFVAARGPGRPGHHPPPPTAAANAAAPPRARCLILLDTEPKIDHTGRADALLFAAARTQHVDEVIRPAIARGQIVLCDRYADLSMAYQVARARQIPLEEMRALQQFATGGLWPDLTILLDLPVDVGLSRKSDEVTRFEAYHDVAYHERVRAAFLSFAAAEPERYAIVDATQPPDAVLAATPAPLARLADRWLSGLGR
ncbi:MAG: dTMP kinase [Chloroflexota bacterium]